MVYVPANNILLNIAISAYIRLHIEGWHDSQLLHKNAVFLQHIKNELSKFRSGSARDLQEINHYEHCALIVIVFRQTKNRFSAFILRRKKIVVKVKFKYAVSMRLTL